MESRATNQLIAGNLKRGKETIRSKVQGKERKRVKAQKVQKGQKETKEVKAKGRPKVERAKERQRVKEKEKEKAPTALKKQAPQIPIEKTGMKEETRVKSPGNKEDGAMIKVGKNGKKMAIGRKDMDF